MILGGNRLSNSRKFPYYKCLHTIVNCQTMIPAWIFAIFDIMVQFQLRNLNLERNDNVNRQDNDASSMKFLSLLL